MSAAVGHHRIAAAVEQRIPVPGHVCVVDRVPDCDLCGEPGFADVNLGRGWAMVCEGHFESLACDTGVGIGQIWITK